VRRRARVVGVSHTSLIFKCKYCPIVFGQFRLLVSHYESEHNPGSERYQKLRHSTFYSGGDSGCWQATEKLGHQSSCLSCPFPKCLLDEWGDGPFKAKRRKRNEAIAKLRRKPTKTVELASMFGLSIRTIQRILVNALEENN